MKVARKHIIAAIEAEGKLISFPKYMIKVKKYVGKKTSEFGWTISILPKSFID